MGRPALARRRRGRVLAGMGDGWSLWVPVELWDRLNTAERVELALRQAALLETATRPLSGYFRV